MPAAMCLSLPPLLSAKQLRMSTVERLCVFCVMYASNAAVVSPTIVDVQLLSQELSTTIETPSSTSLKLCAVSR